MLCACKTMYLPNMQNVPMFKEKGELQATIAVQNAQLAYSASEHVGVIASMYNRRGKIPFVSDDKTTEYKTDSYEFDFGAGYMLRKDDENKVEIYGGYGFGRAQLHYIDELSPSRTNSGRGGSSHFRKFFIQPVFIQQSKDLDFGFSVRTSLLDFYDFQDKLGKSLDVKQPLFVEPAVTINKHVGAFSFRGQLQFSFCAGSAGDGFGAYDPYKTNFLANAGITIDLIKLLTGDF